MARILPSFSPLLRKWLFLAARLAVLGTLLAYAFARVDVHELQRQLMQSQLSLVLAVILFPPEHSRRCTFVGYWRMKIWNLRPVATMPFWVKHERRAVSLAPAHHAAGDMKRDEHRAATGGENARRCHKSQAPPNIARVA